MPSEAGDPLLRLRREVRRVFVVTYVMAAGAIGMMAAIGWVTSMEVDLKLSMSPIQFLGVVATIVVAVNVVLARVRTGVDDHERQVVGHYLAPVAVGCAVLGAMVAMIDVGGAPKDNLAFEGVASLALSAAVTVIAALAHSQVSADDARALEQATHLDQVERGRARLGRLNPNGDWPAGGRFTWPAMAPPLLLAATGLVAPRAASTIGGASTISAAVVGFVIGLLVVALAWGTVVALFRASWASVVFTGPATILYSAVLLQVVVDDVQTSARPALTATVWLAGAVISGAWMWQAASGVRWLPRPLRRHLVALMRRDLQKAEKQLTGIK